MIYRNAFMKHDAERYGQFVKKAVSGETVIHSAALYPYDIMEKVLKIGYSGRRVVHDETLEAQWRQLPNDVWKAAGYICRFGSVLRGEKHRCLP